MTDGSRAVALAARNAVMAHITSNEQRLSESITTILEHGPHAVGAAVWSMSKVTLMCAGIPFGENPQFAIGGVVTVDEEGNRSEVMPIGEDEAIPKEIKDALKILAMAGNDDKDTIHAMVMAYWNDGLQATGDLLCAVVIFTAGAVMSAPNGGDFGFLSPN